MGCFWWQYLNWLRIFERSVGFLFLLLFLFGLKFAVQDWRMNALELLIKML